jgi:hypothetical protein
MKKNKILWLCYALSLFACAKGTFNESQTIPASLNKKITSVTDPNGVTTVRDLKFLQINVWQEGTSVTGGYDAIVNEVARAGADFVFLSEVRNYNNVDFTNRLVQSLKTKGLTYYAFRSDDSGILSKYPIVESASIYPVSSDHGSIYKLVALVDGQRIAAYTAHLDYTNYACYLPRGYSGVTWAKLPNGPETDVSKVAQMNLASYRDEAIRAFTSDANTEKNKGAIVFLGGDFNEPSMFDWVVSTANLYDHHGVLYNWDATSILNTAGFKDSYRSLYPSPVTHPGFTYPSDNPAKAVSSLTWAPDADERERIDYIFFSPASNLTLKNSTIVGPDKSIVRNVRTTENTQDPFVLPLGIWPTDHKALLSTFELTTTASGSYEPVVLNTGNVRVSTYQPGDGSVAALFDNNTTTFFTTFWNSYQITVPQWIVVDLGVDKASKGVAFQYTTRTSAKTDYMPTSITIQATNQAPGNHTWAKEGDVYTDADRTWTDVASFSGAQYCPLATNTTSPKLQATATSVYRYWRFFVKQAKQNPTYEAAYPNAFCFQLSELKAERLK